MSELPKKPMTIKGYKKLALEYENLLKVQRPKIVQGVADAAAEGDRSENAEYIYGKKKLRELDKRLRYLTALLKEVQLIDPDRLSGDIVCFGSTVIVEDENGKKKEWMIVGEGEAEDPIATPTISLISWKSPVAMGLLGKKIGTTVNILRPSGEAEFTIIGLKFGDPRSI